MPINGKLLLRLYLVAEQTLVVYNALEKFYNTWPEYCYVEDDLNLSFVVKDCLQMAGA